MARELGSERRETVRILSTGSIKPRNWWKIAKVYGQYAKTLMKIPIVNQLYDKCIVGKPRIKKLTAESIKAGNIFQNKFS